MSTSRNSVAAYHALKRSIERQISISRFSHIFYRRDGVLCPFRRVYRPLHSLFRTVRYFTDVRIRDVVKNIRVTAVQMCSKVSDPYGNISLMERFVSEHSDSDIICFPEMCLSGYSSKDPDRFALTRDSDPVLRVCDMSSRYGCSIVFGYIEPENGSLYVHQEVVEPSRERHHYRKCHLGQAEAAVFSVGNDLPVFDIGGVCVGLHLCTESHIPEVCMTFRNKGAELVIVPFANGIAGERRRDTWHRYLPARANDNGMFVVGCSASGDNGNGAVFGGGLIAIDPKGRIMDEYYGDDDHSITVDIGGRLPRDGPETMMCISYFDRRRPELYSFK